MKKYIVRFICKDTNDFVVVVKTKNINGFIKDMEYQLLKANAEVKCTHYEKLPIKVSLKKEDWKLCL